MAIEIPKRQFASSALLLATVAILSLAVGCATSLEPRSRLDTIRSSETLRVGTTGDFMPFSYRRDGSNSLHGVDITFARKLANAMGVNVEFVHTTWPKLTDDLLADKFDIGMSGISITPERLKIVFFSRPIMSSGKVAIARDENADRFRTVSNINQAGVRVIVNPGGTNEAFARKHFPQATIILNDENLTVFEKIVSGVADVMVTDAVEATVQEVIHPALEITNRDTPFNSFEFGLLLPRDQALKNFVDTWLENQRSEQTYRQLFDAELIMIEAASSGGSWTIYLGQLLPLAGMKPTLLTLKVGERVRAERRRTCLVIAIDEVRRWSGSCAASLSPSASVGAKRIAANGPGGKKSRSIGAAILSSRPLPPESRSRMLTDCFY